MAIYGIKTGPIVYQEAFGVTGIEVVYTRADYGIDEQRHICYETSNGSGWSIKKVGPADAEVSDSEDRVARRRLPEVADMARFLHGCPQPGYREEIWDLLQTKDSKYSLVTSLVRVKVKRTYTAEKGRVGCLGDFVLGEIRGVLRSQFKPKEHEPHPPKRLIVTEIFFQEPLVTRDLSGVEILMSVAGSMMLETKHL